MAFYCSSEFPSDISTFTEQHWTDMLKATSAFSATLKGTVQPKFLSDRRRSSPSEVADRVAWGEQEKSVDESLANICTQLRKVQKPMNVTCQLINGDMTGTTVFSTGSLPTVVNMLPLWRFAAFSRAIVVGDALVKGGKDQFFILNAGFHTEKHLQLLLRALLFRIVERSEVVQTIGPVSSLQINQFESAARKVRSLMAVVYSDLASKPMADYTQTGELSFLNAAISFSEHAIACADDHHPDWGILHHNLSDLLRMRPETETDAPANENDIDRAVDCAKVAIESGGNYLDQFLHHHSNALLARYESFAVETDLKLSLTQIEEAIKIHRTKSIPLDIDIAPLYSILACIHKAMFERYGRLLDIDTAISAAYDSIGAFQSDQTDTSHEDAVQVDPDYPAYQNQLGNVLSRRFERTGALIDVDASIVALKVAIKFKHRSQAAFFTNLGDALRDRFERTGQSDDLEEAVKACGTALGLTLGKKHPRRGLRLHNAGCALQRKFEAGSQLTEAQRRKVIDKAIGYKEEAYELLGKGMGVTSSLVSGLSARSNLPSCEEDLNRAITLIQNLGLPDDEDNPAFALYMNNVGNAFKKRYERDSSSEDLTNAIEAYKKAHGVKSASALERITAAHNCATLLYFHKHDVHGADRLLRSGVQLMPQCCPQSIDRTDQQFFLSALYGLSSSAAAVCLEIGVPNAAAEALDLLETGRGIVSTIQLRSRADLTVLAVAYPKIAERFKALRDEIDGCSLRSDRLSVIQGGTVALQSHQLKRRHSAVDEFDDLIAQIRNLGGFDTFLSGPSTSDLVNVSENGPIVILNVASIRCDAIIIRHGKITCLPLPDLSAKEAKQKAEAFLESIQADDDAHRPQTTRAMNETLEWLWESAIKQILEALGLSKPHDPENGPWPRIWWIPTGVLSCFPIHAAGYHGRKAAKGNVLDCVVSSYAPSVKALVSAKKQSRKTDEIAEIAKGSQKRVALVAAPEPPERSALSFAKDEIERIEEYMAHHEVKSIHEKPTKINVTSLLAWCYIIHLACHGDSLTDPSASRIVLDDWLTNSLTVRDISQMHLPNAGLIYISACHAMRVEMLTLQDENIHLVGACLLAGFPRVIGTLWQVDDKRSWNLSRDFYQRLFDGECGKLRMENAAVAFHEAVRVLRDATMREEGIRKVFPPDPMIWPAYVYVGV
jgi:tetratricopeptide (TPR) repeat protein